MIYFFAEDVNLPQFDQDSIAKWLLNICSDHNREISNINYIFCSDDYLLKLNKEHLNHDYYTDILTFPLSENPIVSDIFMSLERINENAKNYSSTKERELLRVMVHGLLHLLGFEDQTADQKEKMRQLENDCLQLLNASTP